MVVRALMCVFVLVLVISIFVMIRFVVLVRVVMPSTAVKQHCGWPQRPQGR
jgi:hypothetical protein